MAGTTVIDGIKEMNAMAAKTCAACDYPLDENAIQVKIGGKTVDVCCEDCANKLRETHASATAAVAN